MIKESQFKKLSKVFARAQFENAAEKKEKKIELDKLVAGSPEHVKLGKEIGQIRTISDGTKQTYSDVMKSILRTAERDFGVSEWKHLKKEHTEAILQDKIEKGESGQNIRKVMSALDYFQKHATKTRVFKEKHIDLTDHPKNLKMLKDKSVERSYLKSHRYRASKEESLAVIEEMEKRNPFLAAIARYQLLTGFRVSEAIRQEFSHIDLDNDRHGAFKAKGGLNNIVHTGHHASDDKAFVANLIANHDKETNRIFRRQKDDAGNYKSDEQIRLAITRLASRCAKKLGIGGDGLTFSSHCFRGSFGNDRMKYYAKNHVDIDRIIQEKIKEQPRLEKKYDNFEKRIKGKVSEKNRHKREIQLFEKIQWLVSTDLNHSRQDIARYYVSVTAIKSELAKYQ